MMAGENPKPVRRAGIIKHAFVKSVEAAKHDEKVGVGLPVFFSQPLWHLRYRYRFLYS